MPTSPGELRKGEVGTYQRPRIRVLPWASSAITKSRRQKEPRLFFLVVALTKRTSPTSQLRTTTVWGCLAGTIRSLPPSSPMHLPSRRSFHPSSLLAISVRWSPLLFLFRPPLLPAPIYYPSTSASHRLGFEGTAWETWLLETIPQPAAQPQFLDQQMLQHRATPEYTYTWLPSAGRLI